MKIAFFGSSLLSCYWNGAATYYRGIIRALHSLGHRITFYEPDAYGRQQNRDLDPPDWAQVRVYEGEGTDGVRRALKEARSADWIIKASGVGVHDELLEREVLEVASHRSLTAFWDVDAPATLDRLDQNPTDPFGPLVREYDVVFTYGGGEPVISAYKRNGARECIPVYNALDCTTHFPVEKKTEYEAYLTFLGNRLPDREARVDKFFFRAASQTSLPFLLGGNGWDDKPMPPNVRYIGHVPAHLHNALNCSARAVLNISRESMARYGFSPATRVFEAAGAGACLITDDWQGIDSFFEPGKEILVARDGAEVAELIAELDPARARAVGNAALRRALDQHTYLQRARLVDQVLAGNLEAVSR